MRAPTFGGPYRLDAATQRWISLTDVFGAKDWNLYGVESLALDPNDANRVYLALGTYINDWAGQRRDFAFGGRRQNVALQRFTV